MSLIIHKGNATETESESSVGDSTETDSGSVVSNLEITATFTYPSATSRQIAADQALAALAQVFPEFEDTDIDFENATCYDDTELHDNVNFYEELKPILSFDDYFWLRTRGWTEGEIFGLEFMCQERRMGKTQKQMVAEIEEFENPGSTKTVEEVAETVQEEIHERMENKGTEMTEEDMKTAKKLAKKMAKLKTKKANRIKRRS